MRTLFQGKLERIGPPANLGFTIAKPLHKTTIAHLRNANAFQKKTKKNRTAPANLGLMITKPFHKKTITFLRNADAFPEKAKKNRTSPGNLGLMIAKPFHKKTIALLRSANVFCTDKIRIAPPQQIWA